MPTDNHLHIQNIKPLAPFYVDTTWSEVTRSLQLDPANLVEMQALLLRSQTFPSQQGETKWILNLPKSTMQIQPSQQRNISSLPKSTMRDFKPKQINKAASQTYLNQQGEILTFPNQQSQISNLPKSARQDLKPTQISKARSQTYPNQQGEIF